MEDRKFYISITSGTIIKSVLWVGFLFLLYYIRDIILIVLAAIVIASAIEPAADWCIKHRIRRLPAVIGIYFILAFVLAIFFIFFIPSVLSEALTYLNNLPSTINLNDLWNAPAGAERSFSISEFLNMSKDAISGTTQGAFRTASLIFGGAVGFVLMIVLSFYLAVQEDGVGQFLKIVSPIKHHEYVIDLWRRSQKKIGYWMQGQLLLAIIVGVLVYLGLMILGVKHALLLASLAAIFEIIPIFGPIIAAVPAILIALVDGGVTQSFLVMGLYIIIQQFENHLLYPLVVRKIVGISPMIVILALIIGAKLAGFLGALLAVPISAALMEWIYDIDKGKREAKRIAEL